MVTDQQVRRLVMVMKKERHLGRAASKAGMDEKTGRKYLNLGKLPSQCKKEHTWKTRNDPFEGVWPEIREYLEGNPGLEAKTLFEFLQGNEPGKFADGQLRTLQRKIKVWRAIEGPGKEVFFPQQHYPGKISESDFTRMSELRITINRFPFPHLIYHFVLTYSNWETGTVCFSESYEALSEGLQNALWELGGVPEKHRTDRLSAAIHKECNSGEFTERYEGLLNHYGLSGVKTQPGEAHENGDIEQRHYRLKKAVDQALMLRGSRDFGSVQEYEDFLRKLFRQLNAGRKERLDEELQVLKILPRRKLDDCKKLTVRVGPSSTIRVLHNTYSVNSRLIGENIQVRAYSKRLEIWYGQKQVDVLPRLRGESKHAIQYRHIIDWLVRKPGAFEQYRYRQDLFPSTTFRMAYDLIQKRNPSSASKRYLKILYLAAHETETGVENALRYLLENDQEISENSVKSLLQGRTSALKSPDVQMNKIDLGIYDCFLGAEGASA